MPGVISFINVMPYSGNYQSFKAPTLNPPAEGPKSVPVSAVWSSDGVAPAFAVEFNLAGALNVQPISQICSLYVDNLSNDSDVSFYFSDTQFRLDVPADTVGLFPVITNGTRFIGACPNATDGDVTFVQILNFNPPPVSVSKTQFVSPQISGIVNLPTNSTPTNTTLFTGAGSIRAFSIDLSDAAASAADNIVIILRDGVGGKILYETSRLIGTVQFSGNVVTFSGLDIPFATGVVLNLTDSGGFITGGGIFVNLYVSVK